MAENIFPYELPDNWHWSTLGNVAKIFTGNSINEKIKHEKYFGKTDGFVYIATKDVGFDNVINYDTNIKIPESENFKVAPKCTTLLCIEGGSAGKKIGFTNQPVCFVNKLCAFVSDDIYSKLIYFFMQTAFFLNQFNAKKHGLIGGVSIKNLAEIFIPLPPLDEQKRIVAIIESLFSKLDAAKSIVQKILDGYELRRAAILHKAFTGELTNKKPPIVPISEILEKIFIGPFGTMLHKEEYISGGIPVINPKHISNQKIFPQTTVTISSEKAKMLSSYRLMENDIIMGRRGEMGRTAPVTEKEVGWICGTGSLVLRSPKTILAKFYSQILASQFCIQYLENVSVGSTMKNLNERVIRNMPVPFFKLDEQKEIVRVLDSLLDKEQRTKEIAEKILSEIDLLKRTILARAFRGELGTNNPSEKLEGL